MTSSAATGGTIIHDFWFATYWDNWVKCARRGRVRRHRLINLYDRTIHDIHKLHYCTANRLMLRSPVSVIIAIGVSNILTR